MHAEQARTPFEVPSEVERTTFYDNAERAQPDIVQAKNRVQWGPIVAGIVTSIATLLVLTVLGLAVGASAFEPRDVGESVGNTAAIWGVISVIIALFLGGWVAAKSAAVAGTPSGVLNGLMVGCAMLAILIWVAGSSIGGLLGAVGTNIADITNLAQNQGISAQDVEQQASQLSPQQVFDSVQDSSWWTLLGLLVALIASAIGGAAGHNNRDEVIQAGR